MATNPVPANCSLLPRTSCSDLTTATKSPWFKELGLIYGHRFEICLVWAVGGIYPNMRGRSKPINQRDGIIIAARVVREYKTKRPIC